MKRRKTERFTFFLPQTILKKMKTEETRENVSKISKLLGTNVRATILDGRMFTGIFKVRFVDLHTYFFFRPRKERENYDASDDRL